jgi:DNA-binding MarR family transcriptional regulator
MNTLVIVLLGEGSVMPSTNSNLDADKDRIVLGLLESVERDGSQSQRHLALELGIALGLVNSYLKRCIKKGLVKVSEAPARRYAYYLTPQGFAEKSRLTVDYLSSSFSFFRRARSDCSEVLKEIVTHGSSSVVLAGVSDLTEIAIICALECKVSVVAVIDPNANKTNLLGVPVVASFDAVPGSIQAVIITDLTAPRQTFEDAQALFGSSRVWAPALLGLRVRASTGSES